MPLSSASFSLFEATFVDAWCSSVWFRWLLDEKVWKLFTLGVSYLYTIPFTGKPMFVWAEEDFSIWLDAEAYSGSDFWFVGLEPRFVRQCSLVPEELDFSLSGEFIAFCLSPVALDSASLRKQACMWAALGVNRRGLPSQASKNRQKLTKRRF